MSLYDRLFKPRRYTLPNGAVVEEKRSRAPLVILIVLALEYADRIIGIRAGKIVYDGPSANVDQSVLDAIYGDDSETEADA